MQIWNPVFMTRYSLNDGL